MKATAMKPYPVLDCVNKFVDMAVFKALLREHEEAVMFGFDSNGRSFIGWMFRWDWFQIDVARAWLTHHPRDATAPRVFTFFDHETWLQSTFSAISVLRTFSVDRCVDMMKAAIRAGVALGTPGAKEEFCMFVQPFVVDDIESSVKPCSVPHLRAVLAEVLKAPVGRLHWEFVNFATFTPEDRHLWAVDTVKWFQRELKAKFVADAIAAAARM